MNTVPKNRNDAASLVDQSGAPLEAILSIKDRINARLNEFAARRSYHTACEPFMASVHELSGLRKVICRSSSRLKIRKSPAGEIKGEPP